MGKICSCFLQTLKVKQNPPYIHHLLIKKLFRKIGLVKIFDIDYVLAQNFGHNDADF